MTHTFILKSALVFGKSALFSKKVLYFAVFLRKIGVRPLCNIKEMVTVKTHMDNFVRAVLSNIYLLNTVAMKKIHNDELIGYTVGRGNEDQLT